MAERVIREKTGGDTTRTQDNRGQTGRSIDADKLENDVQTALDTAGDAGVGDAGDTEPVEISQEEARQLQQQVRREKQRADAAEARAREQEGRTADALDEKAGAQLNTLKTAKTQFETVRDDIRRRLAVAHSEGDFNEVADLQVALSTNSVQLNNIENGIVALENQPKAAAALARRGEPGDAKFHQVTKGMDPASKDWFRRNPEYYQDDRKLQRVIAAHNMVMTSDDPPEPNTDEYFELIQRELKDPKFTTTSRRTGDYGEDEPDDDVRSGAAGGQRRVSDVPPASAPPGRNRTPANASGNGRVRLTREELEIAESTGQTPEEYQANKDALLREDRIGPRARNRNMH